MVFAFISAKGHGLLGFTDDAAGSKLPMAYAPWERMSSGGVVPVTGSPDHVTAAIETQGYYLAFDHDDESMVSRGTH